METGGGEEEWDGGKNYKETRKHLWVIIMLTVSQYTHVKSHQTVYLMYRLLYFNRATKKEKK